VSAESFDLVVIGSGPAGHKAALCAANAGKRVLVIEESRSVGGACVERGTIPSKTLRETASALATFRRRTGGVIDVKWDDSIRVQSLMTRLSEVLRGHHEVMAGQLEREGITLWKGRASFVDPHAIEVRTPTGQRRTARGEHVLIATGSVPRSPGEVPIDHEHLLDSDSVLAMTYLPRTMIVIGSGVIATEYASIFASLGVKVTVIDKASRPLPWCDPELTAVFQRSFEAQGGVFLGERTVTGAKWDGVSQVEVSLSSGDVLRAEKLVYAMGRVANTRGLALAKAGLSTNARGLLEVDAQFRTAVPHVLAVGDVIGPPSLASTSAEQGRRAVCHAYGLDPGPSTSLIPVAVYTLPEIATVGLTEAEATKLHGAVTIGRADFRELSRGRIGALDHGLIKLVADGEGRRLLGVQVVGEGAAELVHVGQMALIGGLEVSAFVNHVFNFPTLAEGYRVAALDLQAQRRVTLRPTG
jgi:NAD(P) transhydrogenase